MFMEQQPEQYDKLPKDLPPEANIVLGAAALLRGQKHDKLARIIPLVTGTAYEPLPRKTEETPPAEAKVLPPVA